MTPPTPKARLLVGRVLLITGIVLVAMWAVYFVQLVRPRDVWDFCPLSLALAVVLIGLKLARYDELILAHVAVSWKRDLVFGLALGSLTELILWYVLNYVAINERHIQLERLQEPGIKIAFAMYRHWRADLGHTSTVYLAMGCFFMVEIAVWSSVAFTLLSTLRFLRRIKAN